MLWRILTALWLIPLTFWAIIALNTTAFAVASLAFFTLGAWEWAALCYRSQYAKGLYLLCFFVFCFLMTYLSSVVVLSLGVLLWLAPAYWVVSYRAKGCALLQRWKATAGLLSLSIAWYAMNQLHRLVQGEVWIILLFLLVWSTDTFAYFCGKKWGQSPLAPLISPGKTQAGFWGGVSGALAVALFVFFALQMPFLSHIRPFLLGWAFLPFWIIIALGSILLAVLGDLFESLIKRLSGVKDSGKLLPGHGGILDRVDSLIAALPFYALALEIGMR